MKSLAVDTQNVLAGAVTHRAVIDWDQLMRHRAMALDMLADEYPTLSYLLLPEVERLINGTVGDTRFLLFTLWVTGARISEALALRPSSFAQDGELLTVRVDTFKQRSKRPRRKRKDAPGRYINIYDPKYPRELKNHLHIYKVRRDRPLFGDLKRQAATNRITRAGQALNLPIGVSAHTLRHSFAVNALLHGLTIKDVQALLGHSDSRSTEVYSKIFSLDAAYKLSRVQFTQNIEHSY